MIETLGPYKILDRIGKGGIGEVYRARDTRHGRTVAIKVLADEVAGDPVRRAQFLLDARAAAALSHPNIATLYEVGEEQGCVFLVFDFIPGQTLTSLLVGHPMNPRRALDLAVQIADALADAHVEGLVHRDLKPDNVIITPKGHAKVLDFGLAAWTAGGQWRRQAPTMAAGDGPGSSSGPYLSPEQIVGDSVDERTDIFSLGVILFEMLTGTRPFAGQNTSDLLVRIVQTPAPRPSTLKRTLPAELDPVFAKALAKSLEHRYESAAALAGELRAVSAILDVRTEQDDRPVQAVARPPRRSYTAWIALAVGLAALAAAVWFIGVR